MDSSVDAELPWLNFYQYVCDSLQFLAQVGEPISRGAEHTSEVKPLAHVVLLRALNTSEAIHALLERQFLIDASTLARGFAEAELFLKALLDDSGNTMKLLRADWMAGRVGHAKAVKDNLRATPSARRKAAQVVAENEAWQPIKWVNIAKEIDDTRPYLVFKKFSSSAAHITAGSLGRHICLNDSESIWEGYTRKPFEHDDVQLLAFECSRALVEIGKTYVDILDIPSEMADWSKVVHHFNDGMLPENKLSAKSVP